MGKAFGSRRRPGLTRSCSRGYTTPRRPESRPSTYRVVPGVLADGLILDAPPGSDFPTPFRLSPNAGTITLLKDDAALSPDSELDFDFYAMRVRPDPGGRPP
jgi:hypothetical protein